MQVAVCKYCFDLVVVADSETYFRLFARVKLLALVALLGLERYPLDVVLRNHRMLSFSDFDMNCAVFYSPNGNVLLYRSVSSARNDLRHRFSAADNRNSAVLDFGNDVAAMLADKKFLFHGVRSFYWHTYAP